MSNDIEYEKNDLEEAVKRNQQKYLKQMTRNNNSCKHDYTFNKKICEQLSIDFMREIADCSKEPNMKNCKKYVLEKYQIFINECIKKKRYNHN